MRLTPATAALAMVMSGLAAIPAPAAPESQPATLPAAGVLAWYPLDGDAKECGGLLVTARVESAAAARGRDGQVTGAAPTRDRFGREGKATQFDGTNHSLYVDGKLEHRVKGIFKASNDEPLRIGAKGDGNAKRAFFKGAIDDVLVYDRALGEKDIAALAAAR